MKEILITSSVLILALLVLRLVFGKKVRRTLIYGAWALVALRLLIPVQIGQLDFSVLTAAQPIIEAVDEQVKDVVLGTTPEAAYRGQVEHYIEKDQTVFVPEVQEQIQQELAQGNQSPEVIYDKIQQQYPEQEILTEKGQELVNGAAGFAVSDTLHAFEVTMLRIWLAGIAIMAVWFAVVNLRHSRMLRRNREKLERDSPIPVYVSEKVGSPCLVGLFRPVIYLTPESAASEETMRHVLTHELTHYAHKDHIWSLVRCVCLCVYWFDPLVWVAAWFSRRDCELACDEGALKQLGEESRFAYGKTLLEVVSHAATPAHLLQTATAMNETKKQLKERVNFIVKKPKLSIIAAVCMVLVCAIVAGCATAGPTTDGQLAAGSTGTTQPTTQPTTPGKTTQPTPGVEDTVFSVALYADGDPVSENPYAKKQLHDFVQENGEIYALWTDGKAYHIAAFDENGVARITGLDGTYRVNLSALPRDYCYDPNNYYASNDDPQIQIDLDRLFVSSIGDGSNPYYPYVMELPELGVYEITINSPDEIVYCHFKTDYSEEYWVRSRASVVEDAVDPDIEVFPNSGSSNSTWYTMEARGPESESGFCTNFIYSYISDSITFGVKATARDGMYPITVHVQIMESPVTTCYRSQIMYPTENLRQAPEGAGAFTYAWNDNVLDASGFRLWSTEDGGDGYYHFYDEDTYAATGGWGPTLYAKITQGTIIQIEPLSTVEYAGNGNSYLTLIKQNFVIYHYKQFIEGFESVASNPGGRFSFCVEGCPCHGDDATAIACLYPCETCDMNCTPCEAKAYGTPGYADAVNSDGCYPVTQELQEFLQLYAQYHTFFWNGVGQAESMGFSADENSMWLWAVGYYTEDPGGLCVMGEEIPNYYD